MKYLEEQLGKIHPVTRKTIACVLAVIIVFSIGFISGSTSRIKTVLDDGVIYDNADNQTQPVQGSAQTDPTLSASQPTSESTVPSGTDASSEKQKADSAPTTKAEILDLFTKSANKIKTEGVKVTRNYEKKHHDEEYLDLPPVVQALGSGLISSSLNDDDTPIEFSSAEEINEKYPVEGQSYVCKATESDIADAACDDDGTYYNITLKFNESIDPAEGEGCFSAFNCIKSEDVTSAPGVSAILSSFSIKYYDAVITCKIEKATGNMVSANYTLPVIISATAKVLFSEINATVGMTFINDYSIEY